VRRRVILQQQGFQPLDFFETRLDGLPDDRLEGASQLVFEDAIHGGLDLLGDRPAVPEGIGVSRSDRCQRQA